MDALATWLPPPGWQTTVEDALEVLSSVVLAELGSEWTLAVQGSVRQGLALRGSDLDVVVHRHRPEHPLPALKKVASSWADLGDPEMRVEQCLYRARVPVVRLAYDKLGIDVSAGDPTRGECDEKVRALLAEQACGDTIAHLCRFAKVFATTRRLNVTHKGGLSSFSWVLLTLRFSATAEAQAALRIRAPKKRLRALWLGLLRYIRGLPSGAVLGNGGPAHTQAQLHIAVPGQPEQNAARCLTANVWRRRIAPALDAGIRDLERGRKLDAFLSRAEEDRARAPKPAKPAPRGPTPAPEPEPVHGPPEAAEPEPLPTRAAAPESLLRLREVLHSAGNRPKRERPTDTKPRKAARLA